MPFACSECNRLWDELAEATRVYSELVGQQNLTATEPGCSQLAKLAEAICSAAKTYQDMREAILDHTATHAATQAASCRGWNYTGR